MRAPKERQALPLNPTRRGHQGNDWHGFTTPHFHPPAISQPPPPWRGGRRVAADRAVESIGGTHTRDCAACVNASRRVLGGFAVLNAHGGPMACLPNWGVPTGDPGHLHSRWEGPQGGTSANVPAGRGLGFRGRPVNQRRGGGGVGTPPRWGKEATSAAGQSLRSSSTGGHGRPPQGERGDGVPTATPELPTQHLGVQSQGRRARGGGRATAQSEPRPCSAAPRSSPWRGRRGGSVS